MSSTCPHCGGRQVADTLLQDLADEFGLKTGFLAHEAVQALRLDESPRRLGRKLARLARQPPAGGLMVENIALEHGCAIWWVRGVKEP